MRYCLLEIKQDKGGLSRIKRIKFQNGGIKVENGSKVKEKRAEGTWAGPKAQGCPGLSRIKGD
jgi:hypothetical protein